MKKAIPIIAVAVAVLAFVGYGIWYIIDGIMTDGYVYIGGWKSTPEASLEKTAADGMPSERDRYTVATHIDTLYFDSTAEMFYISEDGYFVIAEFVSNSKGKWHYHGSKSGTDPSGFIGTHYVDEETKTVYGWKYTDSPAITVNGNPTSTKSHKFVFNGQEYSVDYWWCEGIDTSVSGLVVKNAE